MTCNNTVASQHTEEWRFVLRWKEFISERIEKIVNLLNIKYLLYRTE